MTFNKTIVALTCASLVSISALAFAHNGATGIVKERMDGMSAMGKDLKAISEMIKGNTEYDGNTMRELALSIQSHSGEAMLKLFPEGSMQPASEARLEIWQDWDRFSELAMDLEQVSQELADTAGAGIDPMAFKAITTACAACHKDFRLKK